MVERLRARLMPMRFQCATCGAYIHGKVRHKATTYHHCRRCDRWCAYDWTHPLHDVRVLNQNEAHDLAEWGHPNGAN